MRNQPVPNSDAEEQYCQQAALLHRLEVAFPTTFPNDPEPEKTIHWLAGNIDKGLTRVYAVSISECLNARQQERLVERASQRIGESQLIGLLKEILAASSQPDHPSPGSLAPLLADIAFEGIDQILQQAKALGREENFLHVQCTRVGNQLVVLSDRDPRYDWIMPAVQKRLREELANLHYDPTAIETQSLDITCGQPLRFLDFELRCIQGKHGETKIQYRRVKGDRSHQAETIPSRRRLFGRYHPLRFMQHYVEGLKQLFFWQIVHDAYRQMNLIQVGWRHLPITLFPVLLLLFPWRSPVPWLCFLLIFVCNWRWTLGMMHRLGEQARQRWADVALGTGALVALACLVLWMSDIYANRPQEFRAPASMPAGFYEGRFQGDSWWYNEPTANVSYGLYVPPHFKDQKGPFPLLVFLHDSGGGENKKLFKEGFLSVVANRFVKTANGHFDFVALAPLDPTGRWLPESSEVKDILQALNHVMARHAIDPARVYLTGIGQGGDGVWRLAETYPDRWAALVPVHASYKPDLAKVRHIPTWIFDAAPNTPNSTPGPQTLLAELHNVGTDGRYTEIVKKPQPVWTQAYRSQALYDWLATKTKN